MISREGSVIPHDHLPSQMSYNGGVLSTAPCDPTWTGTKRPISEATPGGSMISYEGVYDVI